MDVPGAAVRLGAFAGVAVLVALAFASLGEEREAWTPVMAADGSPFLAPKQAGVHEALWNGRPVVVIVTTQAHLAGVDELRGAGAASQAVDLPGGLALFALSGQSTHLGCTVAFMPGLGASKDIPDYDGDGLPDGRLMDRCHQGQWDAFHRGAEVPGTPTGGRLPALAVEVRADGSVWGQGFDGPVGAQSR
jgi:Rieske Fe-S protein